MNQPKGSTGPCRENLIAYLAALTTGIILVSLGVSPSAVITVALGMSVLYEKFGASTQHGDRRMNAVAQAAASNRQAASGLSQYNEEEGDEISVDETDALS
ncbi:hypothetical protein [Streptomyces sp. A1136]|uniref:hypothetical protein n=1 Tax=Streptomyces sp. A1136 TaxID=2563102 RepID=UPI00109E5F95|nr:hypothetical protein [Streptomyces sp. A1136]THA45044.1 hypothetical protein E6R62_36015 [Streptomyces sp. A1136]